MKSSLPLVLLGALLAGPALAQPLQVVAAQSEIAFTSRQMGVPVEGRFERFTAQVSIDPKRPEFKLGKAEWSDTSLVADDVQVRFKLVLDGMVAL